MLFDWNAVAAPGQVQDVQPCAPLTLTGDGLWVCLVSSGRCTASVPSAGPLPAGAALLLPPQSVPAGHLVLYPASSLHCVTPVTRGVRQASFLWIQSMVRDDKQRAMLYDLDRTIQSLKARFGDGEEVLSLLNMYHNLLRQWTEV